MQIQLPVIPEGYEITGSTADVKAGAFHIKGENTWGIQFHPEVYHTTEGTRCLRILLLVFADVRRTGLPIPLPDQLLLI